ncbi:hypothetical protein CEY16_13450 [Halalkalibacillus sediminis]|uniref:PCZ2.2 n=1 Tax=Halalkalibacillus sediminis TaxID=2018042 RepID=A0A2I0QR56_9BACI|nr:hypothetical protein [Halalkalibacillus sediminis]PKR76817.1 hypothetical protein CEY16_13450 [Halalkalibacillus sediminis]
MVLASLYIAWYLMPFLCIIFCLNLVSILKKINSEEATKKNTIWLTVSFTLIVWSLTIVASAGVY